MINLEKVNRKSASSPPFKKTCAPAPYFHPPFLIFQIPPSLGEVFKIYSPPLKRNRGGLNYDILWPNLQTVLVETIPHYVFDLKERVDRCTVLNFMIKSDYSESQKEFLDSYFFNQQRYLCRIFWDS